MPHKSNPDLLHYATDHAASPCHISKHKMQNIDLLLNYSGLFHFSMKERAKPTFSWEPAQLTLIVAYAAVLRPNTCHRLTGKSAWKIEAAVHEQWEKNSSQGKKKKLSSSHKCKFRLSAGRACRYTGKQHTTVFCDTLSRAIYFRDAIMPALNSDSMYFSNDQVVICQP